ncbi:hypothetical protein AYO49_04220 [Verrucomicrobiaceae bacterium SCGC AG-212-N21]|nr:hypothetical protein AYO49_04220 [Verrucomicrobiaceae bacterium SCGC AG-212-N21]
MSTEATMAQPLPAPTRSHSLFSPGRIWTLARHTMTQLLRMRVLWFLGAFCVLVLVAAFIFPKQSPAQQLKQLKDWALGAMHVASIVFAVASTALLLPRDLEDRTLYTVLSKPVPRYEYLLGKLIGVLVLIAGALLFMDLVFSGVLFVKQSLLASTAIADMKSEQQDTPENIAGAIAFMSHYGLTWSVHAEVWMAFLRAAVVTALTLLISSFASTTLFTIITAFGFTVAGFGVQLMRQWLLPGPHGFTEKVIGRAMAVVCPDLSLFNLAEPASRGMPVPFDVLANLTGVALLYVLAYTFVCYLFFMDKEL